MQSSGFHGLAGMQRRRSPNTHGTIISVGLAARARRAVSSSCRTRRGCSKSVVFGSSVWQIPGPLRVEPPQKPPSLVAKWPVRHPTGAARGPRPLLRCNSRIGQWGRSPGRACFETARLKHVPGGLWFWGFGVWLFWVCWHKEGGASTTPARHTWETWHKKHRYPSTTRMANWSTSHIRIHMPSASRTPEALHSKKYLNVEAAA